MTRDIFYISVSRVSASVHAKPPCTPTPKFRPHLQSLMADAKEERIQAALAECDQKKKPNYAEISSKYNIHRTTLSRRH